MVLCSQYQSPYLVYPPPPPHHNVSNPPTQLSLLLVSVMRWSSQQKPNTGTTPTHPLSQTATAPMTCRKCKASSEATSKNATLSTIPPPTSQDEDTTDWLLVTGPVDEYVTKSMSDVWESFHHFPMCVLFDVVNPVELFKRGMEFNERSWPISQLQLFGWYQYHGLRWGVIPPTI